MPQIFHPSTNTFSRVTIFGLLFLVASGLYALAVLNRSPYVTQAGVARDQPVQFSHAHHVGELGIDCRYCHTSVETSSFAGFPPTQTCMNCHSQIWALSPMLEPVRASWRSGESIEWTRVYDLPDFVYFNHSIHVAKGIGCASCHGRVDTMNLTWQAPTLHMEWCLGCHRDPGQYVRPLTEVFNLQWEPPTDQRELGEQLLTAHQIEARDDCTVCHR